jgi:uncharacterized protein (TIGR01777 family)
MKVVISGGSGFIGEPLTRALLARGDDVAVLTRDPSHVRAGRAIVWDPHASGGDWRGEVASAGAVINLAGENVAGGRWTSRRKQRILDSRLTATRALVEALQTQPAGKRVLINASAVGFYGVRDDELLTEKSETGSGFLADVVRQWEELALSAAPVARVVILRLGVVLGANGGALGKMLLPFRLGAGGPIASGQQWMSWIDRDDVVRMMLWASEHAQAGAYNVTAPEPVRNREFTRALGAALHRPAFLPAPAFALRLVFGEMADEMLIGGQRVVPERATSEGFVFQYPSLAAALQHALGPGR